jgi:ATP-binding protein involved in chromosome partitioning
VMAVTTEAKSVGERGGRSTGGILPIAVVEIPGPSARPLAGAPVGRPSRPGSMMPVSEDQVLEALRPVQDPELHRSIVELDMVRRIEVDGGRVAVTVALTIAGCPLRAEITNRVNGAVAALDGVDAVDLDFTVMTDDERAALRTMLHGDPAATAGSQQAHGHAEGRAIPFADPGSKTRVLLIASGKGGVGKSSVTTNLSVALARRGRDVAVVDADVWGFSIPRMLGVQHPPVVIDEMLVPPESHGVRCISMGFFAAEDQPVIWRGPMLHKALEQFLTDVFWDDPDYLVIDLPPGTGDISLSLSQFLPRAEVYIVTTPQPAAQRVAQRAAFMAQKVNLEVKGVVENMSWFTGDDGKRYELFGAGGGSELAVRLGVPLLGKVPLVPELRAGSDSGAPIVATQPDGEAAGVFADIAATIDVELAPKRIYHSELRIG